MGSIRQGPPEAIVLQLMQRYQVPTFVETGTFLGSTARWASQHFQHVYTIEFAESIYQQALAAHGQIEHISFLYGHTREKLAEVVAQLATPAIFWLDAHWSAGATYGVNDECPIADELAIILGAGQQHFILIDDARLFLAPPPQPHQAAQWPDIAAIMGQLNAHGQRYTVVLEDVIISAPAVLQAELRAYFQSYTTGQLAQAQPSSQPAGWLGRARQSYRLAARTLLARRK